MLIVQGVENACHQSKETAKLTFNVIPERTFRRMMLTEGAAMHFFRLEAYPEGASGRSCGWMVTWKVISDVLRDALCWPFSTQSGIDRYA